MASFRTARRSMKIWRQVNEALYPFTSRTHVLFRAPGVIQRRDRGELELSFYERVLLELPKETILRFVHARSDEEPAPHEKDFTKWRRLLLGTARRVLQREQVRRIKNLPHLPGRGRRGPNEEERREILRKFNELKGCFARNGEVGIARKAVKMLAERYGYKERNVWKILSRMREPKDHPKGK
jgi:hypothetical protein